MKYLILISVILILPGLAYGQTLQDLILEAEQNNPELQAYELRYNAASEKINEAGALPQTQLSAGYFVSEPETRTGAQKWRISGRQMLPWFGTITARENYAQSLADGTYQDWVIARRQLVLQVSNIYYDLIALHQERNILESNIALLKSYEELALTSVQVNKASVVDVLQLQIRQQELEGQYRITAEKISAVVTAINTLLNRDSQTRITAIKVSSLPRVDREISADSILIHPELIKFDKLFASIQNAELMNQKSKAPNLGIGLDYVSVEERPAMEFSDNGKDIIMPMVSFSVPLFDNRYRSISKQNELKQQAILAERAGRENLLYTQLDKTIAARNEARIAYGTQLRNLEKASDAEEILMKSYETGTIDFDDILDIQELQLRFKYKQIAAMKQYFINAAKVNYLID